MRVPLLIHTPHEPADGVFYATIGKNPLSVPARRDGSCVIRDRRTNKVLGAWRWGADGKTVGVKL